MKKIFTLLIGIVFSITILEAQDAPPQAFSYKATITKTNSGGNVVAIVNKTIGLKISILQGNPGIEVYSETFKPTTNSSGQIDILIGKGTIVNGDFSSVQWSEDIFFLQVWVDINGGTAYGTTPMSTTQLLSVPYALYSGEAGSVINEKQKLTLSTDQLTISGLGGNTVAFTNWDMDETNDVIKTGDQTIAGNKTFTGTITGTVNANNTVVSNVANPIANQDAATKSYVDALKNQITALENRLVFSGLVVKDIDGNLYNTVQIGTQVWMAENLRSTKYSNGDLIGTTFQYWTDISSYGGIKYQWAYNGNENLVNTYGRLYTWYVATDSRNVCPTGWHVPSSSDWSTLASNLESFNVAGGKLKATGTIEGGDGLWHNPNLDATNETRFTALPGGTRYSNGGYGLMGYFGSWWSTNETTDFGVFVHMSYLNGLLTLTLNPRLYGYSVRCLKD